MSVSPLTSSSPAVAVAPSRAAARAADGDYKTPGQGHTVKGADGDYKAGAVPASAASTSSSGVLAAVAGLKKGG